MFHFLSQIHPESGCRETLSVFNSYLTNLIFSKNFTSNNITINEKFHN